MGTGNGGYDTPIFDGNMTDNGDSTYSATFTPPITGTLTVSISTLAPGALRAEFIPGLSPMNDPVKTFPISEFDIDWSASNPLVPAIDNTEFSARFEGLFCPSFSSLLLRTEHDDGIEICIGESCNKFSYDNASAAMDDNPIDPIVPYTLTAFSSTWTVDGPGAVYKLKV